MSLIIEYDAGLQIDSIVGEELLGLAVGDEGLGVKGASTGFIVGLEIGFEVDGAEELAKLGVTEGAAVVELEDEDKVIGVCDGIEVGVNKGVDKGKAEVNFAVGVADKNTVGVLEGDHETLGEVVGAIGRFVVGEVVGENVVGFLEGDLKTLG